MYQNLYGKCLHETPTTILRVLQHRAYMALLHGVCDTKDIDWFNRGVVHSTKDAAVLHTKAILSLTEVSN